MTRKLLDEEAKKALGNAIGKRSELLKRQADLCWGLRENDHIIRQFVLDQGLDDCMTINYRKLEKYLR